MSFDRNLAIINYATKWFKYANSESMVESRTMSHWKVCIHRICFPAIGFLKSCNVVCAKLFMIVSASDSLHEKV